MRLIEFRIQNFAPASTYWSGRAMEVERQRDSDPESPFKGRPGHQQLPEVGVVASPRQDTALGNTGAFEAFIEQNVQWIVVIQQQWMFGKVKTPLL
jgi:hypothetical protein